MTKHQVRVLMPQRELVLYYDRASHQDYRTLSQWTQSQRACGKTVLRVCDSISFHLLLEVDQSIYLDHSNKLPIEIAVIITQLISSQSYEVIILDGLLIDINKYLARLRWILSIFDTQLIIFRD